MLLRLNTNSISKGLLMKQYLFADSKVVVGLKKGHAVLDQYLDDNMKQICHVYEANVNNVSCYS